MLNKLQRNWSGDQVQVNVSSRATIRRMVPLLYHGNRAYVPRGSGAFGFDASCLMRDLALILLSTQCFSMGLSVRRAASEACLADHRQNSILPQRKGFLWRRARSRKLERIH